jgi:hypothetical protein
MDTKSITLHENLPLIVVEHPSQLDDLYADEKAALLLLTRLSGQVAVVAPGQFDALLARLRKLGHLPKVID